MKYLHYRHFVDIFMTEEEAKAEAADALINDIDGSGQKIQRPGILNDTLPSPYPNKKAAAAANNGVLFIVFDSNVTSGCSTRFDSNGYGSSRWRRLSVSTIKLASIDLGSRCSLDTSNLQLA
jgi:hypothetical protein